MPPNGWNTPRGHSALAKTEITASEKLKSVIAVWKGKRTAAEICALHKVSLPTFERWSKIVVAASKEALKYHNKSISKRGPKKPAELKNV